MEMTLKEIAEKVGGELTGDPELIITGVSNPENAVNGQIIWIDKITLLGKAEESGASAMIADRSVKSSRKPLIKTDNPKLAFARIFQQFSPPRRFEPGISPDATVSPRAKIGPAVTIQARAVIEEGVEIGDRSVIGAGTFIGLNSRVGNDTRLYPNVTVNENVLIGNRCIIHSGTVVGGDGFGYVRDENGRQVKIPQVGRVVIEDEVEIGCNVAIDRATFGDTIIHKGVKIDNLVQIAHNDEIGENTAISGQAGLSGSVKVGRNVIMAGQVGIGDHVEIGDNVILAGKAGIASNKKVKPNQILLGAPARPLDDAKKLFVMESRMLKEWKKAKR